MNSLQTALRNPRSAIETLVSLLLLQSAICNLHSAMVTGSLHDISVQALNTKLMFSPTNDVLVTGSGLSAGPPKIVPTANGSFSVPLEAGDYTVSLPLITWRHPFTISVFETNGTVNITNLLNTPRTYTYTNRVYPPLHVNTAQVIAWSTNGESTLLDSTATITAGSLHAGSTITLDAFGSFSDPGVNVPVATLNLKLGSTVIAVESQSVGNNHWHLHGIISIHTVGPTGHVVGAFSVVQDFSGANPFGADTQTATVDTTGSLSVSLTASIDNFTDAESVTCDQLIIRLE